MNNQWDLRFSGSEYVYGTDPNTFFAEQLESLSIGNILFPCEGEGRNAVYAASKGWNTVAFDGSFQGKVKAEKLANEKKVDIHYVLGNAETIEFPLDSFDCIALIYAHFPDTIRSMIHQKMVTWLKPGGTLILEAFNPLQIPYTSGGPKDISMLYTKQMMMSDFKELSTIILSEEQTVLNEGPLHQGIAQVLRFVGRKTI
jgi:SAM-dependent methyltransferase